jgi:hypothetical protein
MSEPPTDGSTWVSAEVFARALEENHALAERVEELENASIEAQDDVDGHKAEITRLREALERVLNVSAKDSGYLDYARWQMMMTIAREALQETDDE